MGVVMVMAHPMMLHLVDMTVIVMAAMVITVMVTLLFLLPFMLIFSSRVVDRFCLRLCGSLGDSVSGWLKSWICRSLLKTLRPMTPLLYLVVPFTLVEDVWLVTRGCCEVFSLGKAAGQGSQDVVSILCSDQTWLEAKQTVPLALWQWHLNLVSCMYFPGRPKESAVICMWIRIE